MKKVYERPEIMFESFVSSTNIAGDCKEIIDTVSRNSCTLDIQAGLDVWHIFTSTMDICGVKDDKIDNNLDDAHNGICYHNPAGNAFFNS